MNQFALDKYYLRVRPSKISKTPSKGELSSVMSRLKGKSALMLFDRYPEYRDKYGRHFWARGYYVETVGNVDEETIRRYIAEQEESDRIGG